MAQRRMFSLKIVNSAKFLKMPLDAQNLYFHLAMRADDDGIVEAWSAMRLVGGAEDSLKLLHAKGFVHVLNEDFVTFITDWHEHNHIRADRKIDSIYKNLLVEILPDVSLIEPKSRSDRPSKSGTSQGQPGDGIGKDRLGKDRLGQEREDPPLLRIDQIIDNLIKLWNTKENLQRCRYTSATLPLLLEVTQKLMHFSEEEAVQSIENLSKYRDKKNDEIPPSNIFERFISKSIDRWTDEAKPWERYKKNEILTDIEEVEF